MKNVGMFKGPLKVIRSGVTSTFEERVNNYIKQQKELYGYIYCDIEFKVDDGMLYAFIFTTPATEENEEDLHMCSCK